MSQNYIVLEQHSMTSKHGGEVYEIKLVGTKDRQQYHTYIDPKNRNYKYWRRVVEHPESGFIIHGCQVKRDDLISADSRITIKWQSDTPAPIFQELYQCWQEQDAKRTNHS